MALANRVIAFDIDPAKAQALSDAEVEAASSIADVAAKADIIFICVPGADQVREVVYGDDGLLGTCPCWPDRR